MTGARLAAMIRELARCGEDPEGGVTRLAYTPAWQDARRLVARWMRASGLDVKEDAAGNLWGRLEGSAPGGSIVTGSHIDTVPGGGTFDGSAGIVAGIAALRHLRQTFGTPNRSMDVVAFCEEENSRFPANCWGSRAVTGAIDPREGSALTDGNGVTIAEAMQEAGFDPSALATAVRTDVRAFIELHVEQGQVLETSDAVIGVVSAIAGQTQLETTVTGEANHAGTTPMRLRKDALVAAARMVTAISHAAKDIGEPAVATVGSLRVAPGAPNVVPGQVSFTVDVRAGDRETQHELTARIRRHVKTIAAEDDVEAAIDTRIDRPPTAMDPKLAREVEAAAIRLGFPRRWMVSGAGHDAMVMASVAPTAMIFIPSRGGVSHSPREHTEPDHLEAGARVLAEVLYRLAYTDR